MYTLGINAAFHDSAACLVHDGRVIAAAEEERFSRIKHAKRPVPFSTWELPYGAIDYCLREAGITLADVDHVAYSLDPALLPDRPQGDIVFAQQPSATTRADKGPWDDLFYLYVTNAPRQLAGGAPHHLRRRFDPPGRRPHYRWHHVEHHLAHEASAFLAAPFDTCAVLTLDGRGERATTTHCVWRHGELTRLKQIDVPHSLGLLYEAVTQYLGFLHSSDEYKVMALASYGTPCHLDAFREIVRVDEDGGYRILGPDLERRFGPPRQRDAPFEARHFDIAASLQKVLEESALKLAAWLCRASGERRLAMAGGVALNCVMNARIRDARLFDEVWVQPAAGDAGTALGAALWIDYRERGRRDWQMRHAYYGPGYDDEEIERFLQWSKLPYRRLDDVADETAELLARNCVVGWFQGRMEFGPRALGARSILASPIDPAMKARLNELKDREDFRPVAPAVLAERFDEWFMREPGISDDAPFMLFVYDVSEGAAARIPAAVHADRTARVQTVDRHAQPRYRALLQAFERLTGVPVLVNTSFNSRGQPIVCSPRDAIEAFYSTPLDALVIGSFLLAKNAAAQSASMRNACATEAIA
ncbi:MAG: carbamoyltransferase C-terminal domain-containing protein [Pseudomonadota bacterium]